MQKNTTYNAVSKKELQICPVCETNHDLVATHCQTCAWYFPLAHSPQYALELSRAKRQLQLLNTFNQVLQGMQVQAKTLEKVSFRLDGLEHEVTRLKGNKIATPVFKQKYDYPLLAPIRKAADFDTVAKRKSWWDALESQWKIAFNQTVLRKGKECLPTDEEIKFILESPTLRIVGPRAMHPSIDFELTNLSGIRHLTNLTLLVLSQNALTNLEGIEHLVNLKTLIVDCNQLTHLKTLWYLPQLEKLYCNANHIVDLHPIANLTNLELINCSYNALTNLDGILMEHTNTLKKFYCLPNGKISRAEIDRVEVMGILCKKN